MDGGIGELMQQVIKATKCGASIWATFRFVSNALFALCWVVALPLELVLNRRMGRRYTGILPLLGSTLLLGAWFFLAGPALAKARSSSFQPGAGISPSQTLPLMVGMLLLFAVWRHRLANWWRFQSNDQVHSFSNGVPFYLYLPRPLARFVASRTTRTEPPSWNWAQRVQALKAGKGTIVRFAIDLAGHLWQQVLGFFAQWRSGQVPTGPLQWIASTVLHPALVIAIALVAMRWNAVVAFYAIFAAMAIFMKARIQKALVVESIYDLFDGRIEQEFTHAISQPHRLRAVEQTGFTVPGLAKAVVNMPQTIEAKPAMPADLAALVTATEGGGDGPEASVDDHASHDAATNHQAPHETPHQDARP